MVERRPGRDLRVQTPAAHEVTLRLLYGYINYVPKLLSPPDVVFGRLMHKDFEYLYSDITSEDAKKETSVVGDRIR